MRAGMEGRYDECRDLMLQMGLISAESSLSQAGPASHRFGR